MRTNWRCSFISWICSSEKLLVLRCSAMSSFVGRSMAGKVIKSGMESLFRLAVQSWCSRYRMKVDFPAPESPRINMTCRLLAKYSWTFSLRGNMSSSLACKLALAIGETKTGSCASSSRCHRNLWMAYSMWVMFLNWERGTGGELGPGCPVECSRFEEALRLWSRSLK